MTCNANADNVYHKNSTQNALYINVILPSSHLSLCDITTSSTHSRASRTCSSASADPAAQNVSRRWRKTLLFDDDSRRDGVAFLWACPLAPEYRIFVLSWLDCKGRGEYPKRVHIQRARGWRWDKPSRDRVLFQRGCLVILLFVMRMISIVVFFPSLRVTWSNC
jgi:hypothetical protein